MNPKIKTYLEELGSHFPTLSFDRRQLLSAVADYIKTNIANGKVSHLIFICTHNSRRSHFGQVWATLAAEYYEIGEQVKAYSGGTEVTAPHINMINALQKAGIAVEKQDGEKEAYGLTYHENKAPIQCLSKLFDAPLNPKEHFAAVMTCTDADQNCPFIPGAEKRFSLPYDDPKISDGTTDAPKVYEERSKEIASEMMFIFSEVNKR